MQIFIQQPLRLLAIVTLLVMMSGEGLASCGDWLADSNESMQSHDATNRHDLQEDVAGNSSGPSAPLCNGPQCRGPEPVAPVRSIPIDLRLQQDKSMQGALDAFLAGQALSAHKWRHGNDSALVGSRKELERPPQVHA